MTINTALLAVILSFVTALNLTFAFRILGENFIAGLIMRSVKGIKPGRRIKLLGSTPIIKGEVISVGPIRTSLMEIGDGEHLPSIRTGRIVKLPNTILINTPIVLYGDVIVDEVIAQLKWPCSDLDGAMADMQDAIVENKHKPVEVGLFQRDGHLIIHGVFEVGTPIIADERTKILKSFLKKLGTNSV